ncbi:MAG: AMP-binding protein [Polyangiales bacterium]
MPAAAPAIRGQTLLDFAKRLAHRLRRRQAFLPSYGMAESTLAITFHPLGTPIVLDKVDADAMKRGVATPATAESRQVLELVSCGVTFPEHDLKVVDDKGNELGERQVGEAIVRGPSVTAGYYKNEAATNEAWRNGWLHTGDLAYRADGNVYICGRVKDLIIINGANHYPQDIEWVVGDIEGVRRGNVVAFSVLDDGVERLVILAEGNSGDAPRLREQIVQAVSESFGLQTSHVGVVGVGALPKTSSGKAQRRKSKAMYENGEFQEHA